MFYSWTATSSLSDSRESIPYRRRSRLSQAISRADLPATQSASLRVPRRLRWRFTEEKNPCIIRAESAKTRQPAEISPQMRPQVSTPYCRTAYWRPSVVVENRLILLKFFIHFLIKHSNYRNRVNRISYLQICLDTAVRYCVALKFRSPIKETKNERIGRNAL